MIGDYLEYLKSVRRYSSRTQEIYRDVLERYLSYCDCPENEAFTLSRLRNYEVELLDGQKLSPRTASLHMSVLSGYCRFLVKSGELPSNPLRLVKKPRQSKRLPVFFREESMKEYFESTGGTVEFGNYPSALARTIVSLLYQTGMRRSELISLNISSFDPARRILTVRGKGDKMREIPLLPSLCEEISLYLQSADSSLGAALDNNGPLLRTPKGGRLYPVYVDRVVKQELGAVEGITARKSPHVLRHTLATELLDDGADLNSIKELLGHSSLAATQVYTHNSIEKLRNIYNNAHPRAKNGGKNGN